MSFSSILNKEYVLPNSVKIRLILSAGFGLTIFLILVFFSPFGLENINLLPDKLFIAFGYGFIAFLIWYVGLYSLKSFQPNKGKLWQILIALIVMQFFGGFFSMIYNNVIFGNPSYFDFFIRFQFIVFLMGIFPSSYLILFMETNYYLKLITQNSDLLEKTTKQITLHDQNPEKNLTISPDNIICIQSQDNYIKVEWKNDENRVNSTLLRATLNSAITSLSDIDGIIQCHRCFLINLNYVDSVKGNALSKKCIMLFSDSIIPIARPKVPLVLNRLDSKA